MSTPTPEDLGRALAVICESQAQATESAKALGELQESVKTLAEALRIEKRIAEEAIATDCEVELNLQIGRIAAALRSLEPKGEARA